MKKLAINGGEKLRTKPFPAYNNIGVEEEDAVLRVLRSGKLSTYLGAWHEDFYGGTEVRALESEWAEYFKVKHAISVNSATSGLICAVGACGIEAGDEVIVSPYTMSASAVAPLFYGGIPIFADVEKETYCLDPKSVEKKITKKTKAIVVVDIFGQPYDVEAINALAKKHNLIVIEDAAQAPGAMYKDRFAGTLGDMGVFSLNYHKHIHSGEGGVIVTDDDALADKLRLIRNHAESVIANKGFNSPKDLANMVGFNFRMTEIECAIAREQLKKLPELLLQRQANVRYLNEALKAIPCLKTTTIRENVKHAFYVHPLEFDAKVAGVHRDIFIKAVKAELPRTIMRDDSDVLMGCGYVKPIYLQPIFAHKIAFGSKGYPFNLSAVTYQKGDCPTCEELHFDKLFTHELMRPPATKEDLDDVVKAFKKVWENKEELK
ncbi:MAG: DegT/DnrJ/EryC1/StrS family aminotransferase [Sulfurospirillaceae bacterium]|nr:DegT/DnrJ/EryC1/StrS family aminotransferase [Sulfurospirillaceae bacterium]